jgi:hypothetical protein
LGHVFHFPGGKNAGRDGAGVHNAVSRGEFRKNQNQREEKEYPPGQSHKKTRAALPMALKKTAATGRMPLEKHKTHKNPEVPFGELKVQTAAPAQKTGNGPGTLAGSGYHRHAEDFSF